MTIKPPQITPYSVENAERLVKIIGEKSATAAALKELKERREAGEDVGLFISGSWIFVLPNDHHPQ